MDNGHHLTHQEMPLEGDGENPPLVSSSNVTVSEDVTTTNAASSWSLDEVPSGVAGNVEEKEQEEDADAINLLSALPEAPRGATLGGNDTTRMSRNDDDAHTHRGDDGTITEPIRGANGADHGITANDGANDNVVAVDGIESQQHFAGIVPSHRCSDHVPLPCGMEFHGEEIRDTACCGVDANDGTTMRRCDSGSFAALRIIERALEVLQWDSAPPHNGNDDGNDNENDNDDDYHNDEDDDRHHLDDRRVVETDDEEDDHHLIDDDGQPYDYHQRQ